MVGLPRVLHVARSVGKESFGVGPIVLGFAQSQSAAQLQTNVWCYDDEVEIGELERSYGLSNRTIRSFSVVGPRRLGYSPWMERTIVEKAGLYDIVHQHGLWTGTSRVNNLWRSRTQGPTVITPHGTLGPWALRRSIWKKRLALFFYERKNLERASCLHALCGHEVENFRSFGLHNPIALIPNGIPEGWFLSRSNPLRFRRKHHLPDDVQIMLYLGRITPIKGLPMLIRALHILRRKLNGWKLVIAGVDEFSHQRRVQSLVEQLTMERYVQFVGPQFGQDKHDAFAAASLFVLPSHSEGAPVAVLEALGAGLPVLTTKASPWKELLTYDCGWWTESSEKDIAETLENAIQTPPDVLRAMGQRGKNLVMKKYTWTQITEKTLLLYDWLLERGAKPDFIVED